MTKLTNTFKSAISATAMLAVTAGAALTAMTPAHAVDINSYGGQGGGSFRSPCRPGHALIGINMRAGMALDAVTAICMPLSADRWEWGGQAYEPTQYWGGGGGGYQKIACQPGDVVRRMKVSAGPWGDIAVVKFLAIECEDLATDYSYKVAAPANGTVTGSKWIGCGYNQIGTGIFGRSGMLVDRIGLSCGKFQ